MYDIYELIVNIASQVQESIMKVEPSDLDVKGTVVPEKRRTFAKWNQEENLAYIDFLGRYQENLSCQYDRRSYKVFHHMAKHVKTRNPEQCRTHHQKMVQGYGSIDEIIERIQQKKYNKHNKCRSTKPQNLSFKVPFPSSIQNNTQKNGKPLIMTKQSLLGEQQNLKVSCRGGCNVSVHVEWEKIDRL